MKKKRLEFVIRPLVWDDRKCGYYETLSAVTTVKPIPFEVERRIFEKLTASPDYCILVAEHRGQVIGCGTVFLEPKLSYGGRCVAHLEDVATRKGFEKNGVGGAVVTALTEWAKTHTSVCIECRKALLDCSDENVEFYRKLGFHLHENCMRLDFPRQKK